mmetsp:Transcript_14988/g.30086  ORF Transcript_14988/g.30086 Transcript_14988/m.30086 type:complete len:317 (-) Transcript_14988:419-1369(-)
MSLRPTLEELLDSVALLMACERWSITQPADLLRLSTATIDNEMGLKPVQARKLKAVIQRVERMPPYNARTARSVLLRLPDARNLYINHNGYGCGARLDQSGTANYENARRTFTIDTEGHICLADGRQIFASKYGTVCAGAANFVAPELSLGEDGVLRLSNGLQLFIDANGWAKFGADECATWSLSQDGVLSMGDGRQLYANPWNSLVAGMEGADSNTSAQRRTWSKGTNGVLCMPGFVAMPSQDGQLYAVVRRPGEVDNADPSCRAWTWNAEGVISLEDERQLFLDDEGFVRAAREGEEGNTSPQRRQWTSVDPVE